MSNELEQIRAALEHQLALYGDLVIMPAGEVREKAASPVETTESAAIEQPVIEPPTTASVSQIERERQPSSPPQPQPAVTPDPEPVKESLGSVYERIAALIPQDSPLHAFDQLEDVQAWVASTELIELDRTRINPVFGVGDPKADLMVIGEAPGADEDKKGEPFVGRAGQLLTKILEAIGFARTDVYIANILKSRPPDNRPPKPEEVKAHLPILHKQISLIQPKLILCVGRTSGTSLLGKDSSLKDMRGTFHDYHGIPVMVTYHPAALLRNPNWKRPTWDDVQQLRERYDELTA